MIGPTLYYFYNQSHVYRIYLNTYIMYACTCVLFLCVNTARERHVGTYNDDVMSFNWIHMKT